jgi:hypothetical protein
MHEVLPHSLDEVHNMPAFGFGNSQEKSFGVFGRMGL